MRSDTPPPFDAEVRRIAPEADGVVSLTLAAIDGGEMPSWTPGAHVDLLLPNGIERQYSLCGDPRDRGSWRIGVLREPESRGGSAYVHASLAIGDRVRVRGPRNHFPLVEAPTYLLIAGGIGVTPLLPMVDALAARGAEWRLLYGGRRASSMAFLRELEPHGGRVAIRPEDLHGPLDISRALAGTAGEVAVYCCGPEGLIAAVERVCEQIGRASLHVERFRPRPGASDGVATAFDVVLANSGVTVHVGAEESIVAALSRDGITVPTSCLEGTCGTCETDVLEGVPDHRDSYLTEEERADNATIMVCCSRALTPRLVLDL